MVVKRNKIIKLYKKGNSIRKISNTLNCAWRIIKKTLIENSIPIRNKSYYSTLRIVEINKNRRGKTYEELYGKERAKEIKEELSKKTKGKNNPMYGKNHTIEVIKKQKERIAGKNHPLFGKFHSEKTKQKMKISKLGEKNPNYGKTREKNSNWRGGISFEPYGPEFNNKFKRAIRKRDNYVCMKCGKHQEKEGKSLCIHHINYDKLISIPQNCCTLCNKCNSEVNFNRPHWTKFFQSLLLERYGYQYSKVGEIILELNLEKSKNE